MLSVLVFDPGESTGWVNRTEHGGLSGGTVVFSLRGIYDLVNGLRPQVVVFENFMLHPGAARGLIHSELYPCQVIGAIKLAAQLASVKYLIKLAPSMKRYSGSLDDRWKDFSLFNLEKPTEHTKDAYLLLKYFEMFYEGDNDKMHRQLTPATM